MKKNEVNQERINSNIVYDCLALEPYLFLCRSRIMKVQTQERTLIKIINKNNNE
jgi:hypothetical protein